MDNENNEKKIVAIYTRVSTDDQARDGYSLGEQLKRITKHCENFEYEIYKIYEEPGISAKNTKDRPKFNQMIEDMKVKKYLDCFLEIGRILCIKKLVEIFTRKILLRKKNIIPSKKATTNYRNILYK